MSNISENNFQEKMWRFINFRIKMIYYLYMEACSVIEVGFTNVISFEEKIRNLSRVCFQNHTSFFCYFI